MSSLDLLVVSLLGGAAAYPAVAKWVSAAAKFLRGLPAPLPGPKPGNVDGWRQGWVTTLIGLLGELQSRPDGLPPEPAQTLCRQLLWEIIGGQPSEKQGAKR